MGFFQHRFGDRRSPIEDFLSASGPWFYPCPQSDPGWMRIGIMATSLRQR